MSKLKLGLLTSGLVLMFCVVAPLYGQTPAAPPGPPTGQGPLAGKAAPPFEVEQFDSDQDGRISRREFVAGRETRFTALDQDRNGILRRADFPGLASGAPFASPAGRLFENADLDGDGDITRDEVGLSGTPGFDLADADGNGLVDGSEIASLRVALSLPR